MAATVDRVLILKLKIKIGDMRIEARPVTHSSDFGQNFSMRNCVKTSQPNATKLMPPKSLEGQKVKRQKTCESVKPSHISRSDLHSSEFGQNFSMRNCVKSSQPNAKKRMPPQSLEGQKVKRQKTVESVKPSYIRRSDLHSEGAVSCLDEEHSCAVSQLTPLADDGAFAKGYETPVLDVQISPRRALRAAMLKSRFADTILRAQQKILLAHRLDLCTELLPRSTHLLNVLADAIQLLLRCLRRSKLRLHFHGLLVPFPKLQIHIGPGRPEHVPHSPDLMLRQLQLLTERHVGSRQPLVVGQHALNFVLLCCQPVLDDRRRRGGVREHRRVSGASQLSIVVEAASAQGTGRTAYRVTVGSRRGSSQASGEAADLCSDRTSSILKV